MASPKVGRPAKHGKKPLYFGMKVTAEEKAAIQSLARSRKKPASQVILGLVKEALQTQEPLQAPHRLSTAELRRLSSEQQAQLLQEQAQSISRYQEIDLYNEDILET